MTRIALSLLMVAVAATADAQNRPNVVIMLGDNVDPNPKAVNMTQFGGAK